MDAWLGGFSYGPDYTMTQRVRVLAAVSVLLVVVVAAGVYLLDALRQRSSPSATPLAPPTADAVPVATQPHIAFRQTSVDDRYGMVGVVPLDEPDAAPRSLPLSCDRIHMSSEAGICLSVDRAAVTTARVLLLDANYTVRHELSTPGVPSRARVSPDGSWAATTTFVTGHSYASSSFSTQTEIYDVGAGTSVGNVEEFAIVHRGEPVTAVDVNVWGVTFAPDSDTFYATVATGGDVHLARGSVRAQKVTMLDVTAECPALSPSGRYVAFKSATGQGTWHVKVRSLTDGTTVTVAETRSVDDQIEWLDENRVVYGLERTGEAVTDVWAAAADGTGDPTLLVPAAWSPAVVRAAQ